MKIIIANTFLKRFKGLMGKKDFDDCLVFTDLVGSTIHTFFMKFEIDVYFIDENKIIFDKVILKKRFYQNYPMRFRSRKWNLKDLK